MHSPMKLATVVVLALSGLATAFPQYGETTTTTPKGYGETTTTKKTTSKTSDTCSYSPTTISSTIKTTKYETKVCITS